MNFRSLTRKTKKAIGMSFWETKQDADKYARDTYPTIRKKMEEGMQGTPEVRSFEVANSTWYGIHAP